MRKDHPHAYGDKELLDIYGGNGEGSSPRVWGQGKERNENRMDSRIIPTRMGTRI